MTWQEYDGVPVALFQAGDIFGEVEVYKNSPRLFDVVSISELHLLVLGKRDFKKIFFMSFSFLGARFVERMDRRFVYLEQVMQTIVDCVFQGKNLFDTGRSVDFEKQGNLLAPDAQRHHMKLFLQSFRSTLK